MMLSEKCPKNNSDNPLTSRRIDGGKNPAIRPGLKMPEWKELNLIVQCLTWNLIFLI